MQQEVGWKMIKEMKIICDKTSNWYESLSLWFELIIKIRNIGNRKLILNNEYNLTEEYSSRRRSIPRTESDSLNPLSIFTARPWLAHGLQTKTVHWQEGEGLQQMLEHRSDQLDSAEVR